MQQLALRSSKNTVWLSGLDDADWRERLIEVLEALRTGHKEAVVA